MIIDCIADLHGFYPKLEGGDLLIVAGDLTAKDTFFEHADFTEWLAEQNYRMKVVIAGNHDTIIEKEISNGIQGRSNRYDNYFGKAIYLEDSGTEFEYEVPSSTEWGSQYRPLNEVPYENKKLKIWGSPWTKIFPGMNPKCKAFTVDTDEKLAEKWALIPNDIDILITHCPPYGYGDYVDHKFEEICVGSKSLAKEVSERIAPKLHVFGHVHEAYGHYRNGGTLSINCSHVNEFYEPVNRPIRIDL